MLRATGTAHPCTNHPASMKRATRAPHCHYDLRHYCHTSFDKHAKCYTLTAPGPYNEGLDVARRPVRNAVPPKGPCFLKVVLCLLLFYLFVFFFILRSSSLRGVGAAGARRVLNPGDLTPSAYEHVSMCGTVTCSYTGVHANLATTKITTSESSSTMHRCGIPHFDVDIMREATSRVVPPTSNSRT